MSLRHGFTTGTAAAAAAKAATLHLISGQACDTVDVPLPRGDRLCVSVLQSRELDPGIEAAVQKDAGDDPDVTHKAIIRARVCWERPESGCYALTGQETPVLLSAGPGVGLVTRPGLPVAVGEPAINPVPQAQIRQAVAEALGQAPAPCPVQVQISVDNGQELAERTFNPRLGIVGGISILGTRGTVKPFSHAAYQATIGQSLDVMHATDISRPCLTTGGRSERFALETFSDLTMDACVQVADFFFFAMREAGKRGFSHVLWAVFLGKLIKQAQGHRYTHAHKARLDLEQLAAWSRECGFNAEERQCIARANTALQVLTEIADHPRAPALFELLTSKARFWAQSFAHIPLRVDYALFDFSGRLLTCTLAHP
ncbi:cobalt-precorrin-5B (C(1))-methyltransferase CbiD [Desulfovibrionales bacterium]